MATALLSRITGRKVLPGIGMTGEISIKGHVIGIGGLKEKTYAAHRKGLKTVLFPKSNVKDLDKLDPTVRKELVLVPVTTLTEVFARVLEATPSMPALTPRNDQAAGNKPLHERLIGALRRGPAGK
ncbi:MAG: hypothetical protein HY078_15070 [Elusimicrobia bacterium]|nr:hypothetical protein [Elusimicrobiota bacterium]